MLNDTKTEVGDEGRVGSKLWGISTEDLSVLCLESGPRDDLERQEQLEQVPFFFSKGQKKKKKEKKKRKKLVSGQIADVFVLEETVDEIVLVVGVRGQNSVDDGQLHLLFFFFFLAKRVRKKKKEREKGGGGGQTWVRLSALSAMGVL